MKLLTLKFITLILDLPEEFIPVSEPFPVKLYPFPLIVIPLEEIIKGVLQS